MLTRPTALALLAAATLFAGGCSGYRAETFDIFVKNETNRPITIGLAKAATGGSPAPYEPLWATPEDKAWEAPTANEKSNMAVVPPGKAASLERVKGQFDARTHGVFRAYWGEPTISEMLAKSRGSPDRVDVDLAPGRNDVRIVQRGGHLAAEVEQAAMK